MEIALSLIEHSSWPLVVLLCVILLRTEIGALIKRLKGVKAGSVEVQLTEQLHSQGLSQEQLKLIGSLSVDEIELFLLVSFTDNLGFNFNVPLPPEIFKSKMVKLQEGGLIQIYNPDDLGTNLRHNTTLLGRRFRALLVNSATKLVNDAAAQYASHLLRL